MGDVTNVPETKTRECCYRQYIVHELFIIDLLIYASTLNLGRVNCGFRYKRKKREGLKSLHFNIKVQTYLRPPVLIISLGPHDRKFLDTTKKDDET